MLKFTKIDHQAKMTLGLSFIEYSIADSIYQLSTNPRSKNAGWCSASKQYLGEFIGVSREHVSRVITKLVELELLEKKSDKSKLLRTTAKWYEVVISTEKTVIKDHTQDSECDLSSHQSVTSDHIKCDISSHPSNTYNTDNNINRSLVKKSIESRVKDLAQEMALEQMHLETICMNQKLEMDYVKNLISSWAQENASTTFQSTNHKRNSFRKFVSNSKMKVAYKGGGQAPRAHTIIQPGERRKKLG